MLIRDSNNFLNYCLMFHHSELQGPVRDITETHNAGVAARNIFHPGLVLGICLKYNNNLSTDYRRCGADIVQVTVHQVWVGWLTSYNNITDFMQNCRSSKNSFAAGKCNRWEEREAAREWESVWAGRVSTSSFLLLLIGMIKKFHKKTDKID